MNERMLLPPLIPTDSTPRMASPSPSKGPTPSPASSPAPSQQQQRTSVAASAWPEYPPHHYSTSVLGTDFSVLNKNPLLNRIGLEPAKRIALITASAAFWGFVLGGVMGSRQSGMQYLAENAHRLPKTMDGWYFYHKKKNYRMFYGALTKGAVYSSKTAVLVALFEILEASADFYRGGADVFNSITAGVASGAIFSVANKLPRQSSKHTLMLGAGYGLVSGALQDMSSFLKGTPVWYLPESLKERSLALRIPLPESDDRSNTK